MQLTFRSRPLIEVNISFEELNEKQLQSVTSWLADHATFIHQDDDEYVLWIPPFDGQDHYIESTYGKEIPEMILQILKESIKIEKDKADQGYVLVAFV